MDILFFTAVVFLFLLALLYVVCIVSVALHYGRGDRDDAPSAKL